MFSEEKWWRGGGGKEKKNPLKESGDHMSPLLLRVLVLQDLMLNIDVEDKNLDRGLNGGQFWDESSSKPCSLFGSMGKDNDPDLQSQAALS